MVDRLFAVERFDASGGQRPFDPFPVMPDGIRLACAAYLTSDDVMLALVEGADEVSVWEAVTAAGWRVDRITTASWATPPIDDPLYRRPVPASGGAGTGPAHLSALVPDRDDAVAHIAPLGHRRRRPLPHRRPAAWE